MRGSSSAATLPDPSTLKAPGYALKSDLAQYCLPTAYSDENRKYAWVNSLCALFLLIGIIGIRPPAIIVRPPAEVVEEIPVVFTPPAEPVKVETVTPEEVMDEQPDTPTEMPQVVTIVAPNTSDVAFAVPVEGAVAFAPARFATPPPPPGAAPKAPGPPQVFSASTHQGNKPLPPMPIWLRSIQESRDFRVLIHMYVSESGAVTNATVESSSGNPQLDKYTASWVQKTWTFAPSPKRIFFFNFVYRLEN